MSYIGPAPTSGFISNAKERYTGITTAYVDLNHSISSLADVIVWVNYVKQDATNLTLTSSTRITLGASLVSSDIVEVAYLGKAVSTQAPATGQVTNDMLAGSIADAKISAMATSKLTGTVSQSQVVDQAINEAKMQISNAPTNGQFLSAQSGNTGGLTWASAGESNDHYFAAKGDGTQTISNGTDTTCEFDVLIDSMDSHSGFNTGTYTYTVQSGGAGLWYLKFGNYFNGANSWGGGEQIQMQLYGAGMNNHLYIDGSSGGNRTDGWLEVNSLVKLAVGDTVKGVVWQNTGGNVTANNNNGNAILGGFRVKAI